MTDVVNVIAIASFANQNPIANVIGVWERAIDAQEHAHMLVGKFVELHHQQKLAVTINFHEGTNPEGFDFIAWDVVAKDSNQKLHEIKITTLPFV